VYYDLGVDEKRLEGRRAGFLGPPTTPTACVQFAFSSDEVSPNPFWWDRAG
jgi:hypothetical protein